MAFPNQRYLGVSSDVEQRLSEHNAGKATHTSKYKPWKLIATVSFDDEQRAIEFEKYMKHGSGHAFAKRHIWPK